MSIATIHHNPMGTVVQPQSGAYSVRLANDVGQSIEVTVNDDGTFNVRCSNSCVIHPDVSNNFNIQVK